MSGPFFNKLPDIPNCLRPNDFLLENALDNYDNNVGELNNIEELSNHLVSSYMSQDSFYQNPIDININVSNKEESNNQSKQEEPKYFGNNNLPNSLRSIPPNLSNRCNNKINNSRWDGDNYRKYNYSINSIPPNYHHSYHNHPHSYPGHPHSYPDHQHSYPGHQHSYPGHQHSYPGHQHSYPGHPYSYPCEPCEYQRPLYNNFVTNCQCDCECCQPPRPQYNKIQQIINNQNIIKKILSPEIDKLNCNPGVNTNNLDNINSTSNIGTNNNSTTSEGLIKNIICNNCKIPDEKINRSCFDINI